MGWEYTTATFDFGGLFFSAGGAFDTAAFQNELNRLGWDGWELVSVTDTNRHDGATRYVVAVFKRPLTQERRNELRGA